MGAIDIQMIHQPHDIEGALATVGFGIARLSALAVSSRIEGDDTVVLRKVDQDASFDPCIQLQAVAVEQDDRVARPLFHIPDLHAVGVNEPVRLC